MNINNITELLDTIRVMKLFVTRNSKLKSIASVSLRRKLIKKVSFLSHVVKYTNKQYRFVFPEHSFIIKVQITFSSNRNIIFRRSSFVEFISMKRYSLESVLHYTKIETRYFWRCMFTGSETKRVE